jgi:ketosteroid isomerase-like protein
MSQDVQDIRDGYAAFAAGDLDAIRAKMAPDVVWHVEGRNDLAGTYRGIDEVVGYFVRLFEVSGGTFRAELRECGELAPGLVAALVHCTGTMPHGQLDSMIVQTYRREGELSAEVRSYVEDGYVWDETVGTAITLPDARTGFPATPVQA